jgi:hypothetical protein
VISESGTAGAEGFQNPVQFWKKRSSEVSRCSSGNVFRRLFFLSFIVEVTCSHKYEDPNMAIIF